MPKQKQVSIQSLRIDKDWHEKIKEIAEKECRTQASVIRQAIKEYLDRRRKDE